MDDQLQRQLASVFRNIAASMGGAAVAKGWITGDVMATVVNNAVPLFVIGATLAWGWIEKRFPAKPEAQA